jgi:hypothetical protein
MTRSSPACLDTEDNKRYFAKLGGIPRLLKLMGPGNHHEVRIKATKAVWNFAGTEELQRLLLGEGALSLHPLPDAYTRLTCD